MWLSPVWPQRRQQKQGAGDIHNVPQGKSAEEARGLCIWACTRGKPFQIRVPVPDPFDVLGYRCVVTRQDTFLAGNLTASKCTHQKETCGLSRLLESGGQV